MCEEVCNSNPLLNLFTSLPFLFFFFFFFLVQFREEQYLGIGIWALGVLLGHFHTLPKDRTVHTHDLCPYFSLPSLFIPLVTPTPVQYYRVHSSFLPLHYLSLLFLLPRETWLLLTTEANLSLLTLVQMPFSLHIGLESHSRLSPTPSARALLTVLRLEYPVPDPAATTIALPPPQDLTCLALLSLLG